MPLLINIRHLATREVTLKGELPASELDIDSLDEMVRVKQPLKYDLAVQKTNESILVRGKLQIPLDCQCVRCLKPFRHQVKMHGTICDLSLQGEEAVSVVNDCVDLTPYLREDILLEFPQHPVCGQDCPGMPMSPGEDAREVRRGRHVEDESSAWAELNKLRF